MVFFPETLARTMLSGDDSVALAKVFLPRCGVAMITLDLMFVFRNACQGMGRQAMPMISGFAEMIVRIAVIVLLTDRYGFAATAYAESSAWASALLINGAAYFYHLSKAKKLEDKEALQ